MDSTTRWTFVGAATVSVVAVVAFWWSMPSSEPVRRVTPRDPSAQMPGPPVAKAQKAPRAAKAPAAPGARGAPRAEGAPSRPASKIAPLRTEGNGPVPDDVAGMIEEHRAERAADSEAKVDFYAERAGWSPETTAEVRGLVGKAHQRVDEVVAKASAGEIPWSEVKGQVREIRADQAREVRDALGDEEFREFARAMSRSRARGKRR